MQRLTIATRKPLPHTLRLPGKSAVVKRVLGRLNRQALLALVLEWLGDEHVRYCEPVTAEYKYGRRMALKRRTVSGPAEADGWDGDDDALEADGAGMADVLGDAAEMYELADSVDDVRDVYVQLSGRAGGRKEVLDRVVEGDWREGLTLYQLAMAETRFVLENTNSAVQWTALRLGLKVKRGGDGDEMDVSSDESGPDGPNGPDGLEGLDGADGPDRPKLLFDAPELQRLSLGLSVQMPSFLARVHSQVSAVMKTHYYVAAHPDEKPATVLRVGIRESPYATEAASKDPRTDVGAGADSAGSWRSVFFVFPDDAPFVYVGVLGGSAGGTSGPDPMLTFLVDAIPAALSRTHVRLGFERGKSALTARSLDTLLSIRGPGRGGAGKAGGAWSGFASERAGLVGPAFAGPLDVGRADLAGEAEGGEEEEAAVFCSTHFTHAGPGERLGRAESAEKAARMATTSARFGAQSSSADAPGLDRLDVCLQDDLRARTSGGAGGGWERVGPSRPSVTLSFRGSNVIGGFRALVEAGAVDGRTMPGWMTGVDGVSRGIVRHGRILGGRGGG